MHSEKAPDGKSFTKYVSGIVLVAACLLMAEAYSLSVTGHLGDPSRTPGFKSIPDNYKS